MSQGTDAVRVYLQSLSAPAPSSSTCPGRVLSQGQSAVPGVHSPGQGLVRRQESGQRSSPGLTRAPSARTGTKESQQVLAKAL